MLGFKSMNIQPIGFTGLKATCESNFKQAEVKPPAEG
jgi:hypothetical protein